MALVDWRQPAERVAALIRALDPIPGARTIWRGKTLKLFEGSVSPGGSGVPGRVAEVGERLLVETGKDMVAVGSVQAPGRKRMAAAAFQRGAGLETGMILGA
jgi:methionyl-tRNA formyltransferase